MSTIPQALNQAHTQLKKILKNSYAPYSKLHVACALKVEDREELIFGVNVENASYGGTLCAERSAIVSKVSQMGEGPQIEFVLIISDLPQGPIPPCGLCLQVLSEFLKPQTPIYLGDVDSVSRVHQLKDFLPLSFSSEMLPG
jgi:cytidine deaminase